MDGDPPEFVEPLLNDKWFGKRLTDLLPARLLVENAPRRRSVLPREPPGENAPTDTESEADKSERELTSRELWQQSVRLRQRKEEAMTAKKLVEVERDHYKLKLDVASQQARRDKTEIERLRAELEELRQQKNETESANQRRPLADDNDKAVALQAHLVALKKQLTGQLRAANAEISRLRSEKESAEDERKLVLASNEQLEFKMNALLEKDDNRDILRGHEFSAELEDRNVDLQARVESLTSRLAEFSQWETKENFPAVPGPDERPAKGVTPAQRLNDLHAAFMRSQYRVELLEELLAKLLELLGSLEETTIVLSTQLRLAEAGPVDRERFEEERVTQTEVHRLRVVNRQLEQRLESEPPPPPPNETATTLALEEARLETQQQQRRMTELHEERERVQTENRALAERIEEAANVRIQNVSEEDERVINLKAQVNVLRRYRTTLVQNDVELPPVHTSTFDDEIERLVQSGDHEQAIKLQTMKHAFEQNQNKIQLLELQAAQLQQLAGLKRAMGETPEGEPRDLELELMKAKAEAAEREMTLRQQYERALIRLKLLESEGAKQDDLTAHLEDLNTALAARLAHGDKVDEDADEMRAEIRALRVELAERQLDIKAEEAKKEQATMEARALEQRLVVKDREVAWVREQNEETLRPYQQEVEISEKELQRQIQLLEEEEFFKRSPPGPFQLPNGALLAKGTTIQIDMNGQTFFVDPKQRTLTFPDGGVIPICRTVATSFDGTSTGPDATLGYRSPGGKALLTGDGRALASARAVAGEEGETFASPFTPDGEAVVAASGETLAAARVVVATENQLMFIGPGDNAYEDKYEDPMFAGRIVVGPKGLLAVVGADGHVILDEDRDPVPAGRLSVGPTGDVHYLGANGKLILGPDGLPMRAGRVAVVMGERVLVSSDGEPIRGSDNQLIRVPDGINPDFPADWSGLMKPPGEGLQTGPGQCDHEPQIIRLKETITKLRTLLGIRNQRIEVLLARLARCVCGQSGEPGSRRGMGVGGELEPDEPPPREFVPLPQRGYVEGDALRMHVHEKDYVPPPIAQRKHMDEMSDVSSSREYFSPPKKEQKKTDKKKKKPRRTLKEILKRKKYEPSPLKVLTLPFLAHALPTISAAVLEPDENELFGLQEGVAADEPRDLPRLGYFSRPDQPVSTPGMPVRSPSDEGSDGDFGGGVGADDNSSAGNPELSFVGQRR